MALSKIRQNKDAGIDLDTYTVQVDSRIFISSIGNILTSFKLTKGGHAAYERAAEKERLVLSFLNEELYSDFKNLSQKIGLSKTRMYELLAKLAKKGLIKKHILDTDISDIRVWSLTQSGRMKISNVTSKKVFIPSKSSIRVIKKNLMRQRVSITLNQMGWENFTKGNDKNFKERYKIKHQPSAIVKPMGRKRIVAIEIESGGLKTPTRYRQILKEHIKAKEDGYWSQALYVVENKNQKRILIGTFKRVRFIKINDSKHPIESYLKMFPVFTIDELRNIKPPKETKKAS